VCVRTGHFSRYQLSVTVNGLLALFPYLHLHWCHCSSRLFLPRAATEALLYHARGGFHTLQLHLRSIYMRRLRCCDMRRRPLLFMASKIERRTDDYLTLAAPTALASTQPYRFCSLADHSGARPPPWKAENILLISWKSSKIGPTFTFAIFHRPSVSSVTFVRPTQAIEIFGNVLRHLVWPSVTYR